MRLWPELLVSLVLEPACLLRHAVLTRERFTGASSGGLLSSLDQVVLHSAHVYDVLPVEHGLPVCDDRDKHPDKDQSDEDGERVDNLLR